MNLGLIVKALGIKIPEEDLRKIEELLPKIPQIAGQLLSSQKATNDEIKERLKRIEFILQANSSPVKQAIAERMLEHGNGTNGYGDTTGNHTTSAAD